MNGMQLQSDFELHIISLVLSIVACSRPDDSHLLEPREIKSFFFSHRSSYSYFINNCLMVNMSQVVTERLGTDKSGCPFPFRNFQSS